MSKIPNELLEAMKKASHKTTFNDSFKVTDFTPKKKTPFKIRLKNSIKKFFNKFKKSKFLMKIKNWYYNNIKKPIQDKKEEKDKLRYIKELKENFSKKFNVDVDTNHPYAGRTLHYQIEILGVRPASAEEVAHRHVHGPGGHQH
jgi:hypothetical protein